MAETATDYTEQQNLTRILTGQYNAEVSSDFADTVVLEAVQITGTRYKYVFTNAEDPRT